MTSPFPEPGVRQAAGMAGLLYLVIIVAGIWSEAMVRGPLLVPDDPAATAVAMRGALRLLRLSIAADGVMLVADVALAVLLYQLLRPYGPRLSLAAMAFRMMQAAVLGANLLNLQAAVLLIDETAAAATLGHGADAWVALHLKAHAHGYDLGLVFFGVNAVLTGVLLARSNWAPRALGHLVGAAGVVYLTGSGIRLLAPGLSATFAPAYALPLLAETGFCLWLMWVGFGRPAERR